MIATGMPQAVTWDKAGGSRELAAATGPLALLMEAFPVPLIRRPLWLLPCLLALTACGVRARLPVAAGVGPEPALPPPNPSLIPTVNIAPARGWPAGGHPLAAPGLDVQAFARDLDHPRWLHVLPDGDVLVAETNAP